MMGARAIQPPESAARHRAMPLASVTRLRVRSIRYVPEFLWRALSSVRQARASDGCIFADVRREVKLTFWTRTLWRDEASMRAFMTRGAHRKVMPKILDWCDEAAVAHWQQDGDTPPEWPAAETRMRNAGRISRVHNPSAAHRRGETVPAPAS
jgi:quinol monooxygenase YgiN